MKLFFLFIKNLIDATAWAGILTGILAVIVAGIWAFWIAMQAACVTWGAPGAFYRLFGGIIIIAVIKRAFDKTTEERALAQKVKK